MDALGTIGLKVVQFFQYIFVPGFFLLFATGIIMFLLARKNPVKKRKGYLYSVFGGIGVLLVLYAPVFFLYYSKIGAMNPEDIFNASKSISEVIYNIFMVFAEPILLFLTYFGIGYLLLAAKEPVRKRLGLILLIASPFTWVVLYYAMDIIDLFKGV